MNSTTLYKCQILLLVRVAAKRAAPEARHVAEWAARAMPAGAHHREPSPAFIPLTLYLLDLEAIRFLISRASLVKLAALAAAR
jgi:hypothetical protein